jgi:hypothetical protein
MAPPRNPRRHDRTGSEKGLVAFRAAFPHRGRIVDVYV